MTNTNRAPRAIPANHGATPSPIAATTTRTGLSAAEIRQIVLEILG